MNELLTPRDWQQIAQQKALELAGTPEASEKLAEAKRYGILADEIERLTTDRDEARALAMQLPAKELEIKRLSAENAAQAAALELAKVELGELQDLIGESSGVYGLHLNGDVSPWSELEQGGRFERLITLPEALAAINALPAAPKGGE